MLLIIKFLFLLAALIPKAKKNVFLSKKFVVDVFRTQKHLHFLNNDNLIDTMKIKAYLKPHCGWSMGVRAIMEKYSLEYEDLDIINNREIYEEMVTKSGQPLSPCVEVNEVMLADVSGEEVENYLLSNNLVQENENKTDVPLNSPCSDEEHEAMRQQSTDSSPIRFF